MSVSDSRGVRGRLSAWAAYAERLVAPDASRRRELRAQPLPRESQELLMRHSAQYRRLPSEMRQEFNRQVQVFVTDKQVTGVETKLTDEARLLVAASAVTLTAGWPGYTWDQLSEVLVYPQHFDRHYQFTSQPTGDPVLTGQAHPWGVVILSNPALNASFANAGSRNSHVGFHEFAHLLDLACDRSSRCANSCKPTWLPCRPAAAKLACSAGCDRMTTPHGCAWPVRIGSGCRPGVPSPDRVEAN